MITIAVVGQTPPPFGGQAIMIERMLKANYTNVSLFHIRMAFSKELDATGKLKPGKLLELLRVLATIILARVAKRATVLYYPPAGPNVMPVLRDIFLLGLTRWMFSKTVLHFHAGGLSQIYEKLPIPLRFLFRLAYEKPDIAIRVTDRAPQDAKFLNAKCEFIVPNGIDDYAGPLLSSRQPVNGCVRILFVGVLREDKGILELVQACSLLHEAGLPFRLVCVGTFASDKFHATVTEYIRTNGLSAHIAFPGVLTGDAKHAAFLNSDVFCFPSFFDSETFGIVLLEALSFALPIVCTDWRGIPDVVDNQCAFLVPINDPPALAEKLTILINDPGQRRLMGLAGRRRFLERFTAEKFHANMQSVFDHLTTRQDRS